ncbi:MAG: NADH-quinone oxidoreductase subunit D [Actinomycetia bacterium]|nr:NADH-quinone oxidoreductase subunit D [Actinomycetes bacterium]
MNGGSEETLATGVLGEGRHDPGTPPAGLRRAPAGVDGLTTEHLIINMGPQHPSTHGVLRVLVEVDGEEVVAAEVSVGYLHRGIEKLAEYRRYDAVGTLLDRGDYISGMMAELAFALATEQLMDVEVPRKAHWLRSLASEINRITSHLIWYGTFGLDAGGMGQFLYGMRDREALLDILEALSGSRMMFNYIRPGGVLADMPTGLDAKIRAFLGTFDQYLDEHDQLLGGNEIFQARVKGVGVIDRSTALAFGLTGSNLRGAGVDFDVRKARPYAAYPELDFEVPLGTNGDAWDRYNVRMAEMRQSARMIGQLIDGMPEGPHMAKVPRIIRPRAGEVYASVESTRGETGIHLVSDGTEHPYRMHYRGPSLFAAQALEEILPGHLIADVVVIIGSTDVMLGEIDR